MRRLLAVFWLALVLPSWAGSACSCPPPLIHLCRCGVYTDGATVARQVEYLHRQALAAFPGVYDLAQAPPIEALAPWDLETRRGEPLQGLYDGQRIFVSNGLLREESLVVVAHELGHAWHFARHPDPEAVSDRLAEGFAEWFAYQLVARSGFPDACDRIRSSRDPLYGDAYRWFGQLEEEFGREVVLKIAFTWLDFDGSRVGADDPAARR